MTPPPAGGRFSTLRETLAVRNPHEPRSLFGEILDWMLAPLLLLWPMSLVITWLVAQTIANRPYDRELGDRVRSLARLAMASPQARLGYAEDADIARQELERSALVLIHTDEEERVYFQVLGRRGELLAGDARLPVPQADMRLEGPGVAAGLVRFRDEQMGDETVRVAYLWLAAAGTPPGATIDASDSEALVQVAETLGKRGRLATEIVKGVILPQFVILPVSVLLVWFALSRGFQPLAQLQQTIRARESHDLSPLDERDVPEEVAPLVRGINELLQRLDRSMESQRHFLADAAHQLKTPLAGLRTQAELAAREIDSGRADPAALKHSLMQIARSSQRAAHMVNQLLAMARAENQAAAIRRQPVDLAAVVRAVVRDFVPRALERRIDLGYEGPAEASAGTRLQGEPLLLGEMVRNLIDNALAYTPEGGTVTARVLPDPFGQVVVLQVEDTGPGIPLAERELVFQPFYRALGTQVDGSGLGLAIVMEVAQRHGAEVTVGETLAPPHPPSGPGARFTVRLPLQPPQQGAEAGEAGGDIPPA